jgi:eukaryotic-like serine/threonine-protein kinase
LNSSPKRRPIALLLLLVAASVVLTGCIGRGSATNTGWSVVTVDEEVVYAALPNGSVTALDGGTGNVRWRFPVATPRVGPFDAISRIFTSQPPDPDQPLPAVFGQPAIADGLLLIGALDDQLHAFDRQTGRRVWTYTVGDAIVGGVAVADGVAYFGSSDWGVYALRLSDQSLVWPEPFRTGNWVWSTPVIDADRVYVGSMDGSVYAINRETGAQEWTFATGGAVPGSVALNDGHVYVGSIDRTLYRLDAETGTLAWQQPLDHWIMGSPLVLDDHVYVTSLSGHLYGFASEDGTPRWDPVFLLNVVRAGPVADGDNILVATDTGEVWRVSVATGRPLRAFPDVGEPGTPSGFGAILSPPVVRDGVVYLGTALGNVLSLDLTAEIPAERWIYTGQ